MPFTSTPMRRNASTWTGPIKPVPTTAAVLLEIRMINLCRIFFFALAHRFVLETKGSQLPVQEFLSPGYVCFFQVLNDYGNVWMFLGKSFEVVIVV